MDKIDWRERIIDAISKVLAEEYRQTPNDDWRAEAEAIMAREIKDVGKSFDLKQRLPLIIMKWQQARRATNNDFPYSKGGYV